MRQLPGIGPGRLPVIAALAAGAGFTALLAATAVVYLTVNALGALLITVFMLASLGLAASGWFVHWRALDAAATPPARMAQRAATHPAGQDSPVHRLLEAVAVEVRSAAGTLRGFAELLAEAPGAPEDEARRQLLEGSRGLLDFAGQLHDYIRFERGRLRLKEQEVDAAELVAAALAACEEQAVASGTVIAGKVIEGVEVSCDAQRIREAISSLVLWALQSSTPGGIIDVSVTRLADGELAIDVVSRADAVAGPLARDRLFEPQLSLTGLRGFALPIARRVALLHAGEVTAASSPGEGTSARLTLPAQRVAWPDANRSARAA